MKTSHRMLVLCCAILIIGIASHQFARFRSDPGDRGRPKIMRMSRANDLAAGRAVEASTPNTQASLDSATDAQVERAIQDRDYLMSLLTSYRSRIDQNKKIATLSVLSAVANEDVLQFAVHMTGSEDPQTRKDGFGLLKSYSLENTQVRDLLLRHLKTEQDVETTRELVRMLVPATMPSEDASDVIGQLRSLSGHRDPDVRSESIRQLVQWQKSENIEEDLYRAIQDPAFEVRQAAIEGVSLSRTKTDRLKTALLTIGGNSEASVEERQAVFETLRGFWLNRDEYLYYMRIKAETGEIEGERE